MCTVVKSEIATLSFSLVAKHMKTTKWMVALFEDNNHSKPKQKYIYTKPRLP
jgi:hypothetical protein